MVRLSLPDNLSGGDSVFLSHDHEMFGSFEMTLRG